VERPYFCALCRKEHYPYLGLIYTQHLQWAINSDRETIDEARKLWLDIIDNRKKILDNPYELDLPRDLAIALASFFYISNFPVNFKANKVEIQFGRLLIRLKWEGDKYE
jgi:hypothetical protein